LATIQTGPEGKKVNKILVAQDVYYPGNSEPKEYYLSILLDRATGSNVIMASTEGGVDIEHVAEHTPEKIIKEWIDPRIGLQGFQARKVAFKLGLAGNAHKEMVKFIISLYNAYDATDSSQFEINPVLKTSDDQILAVDAKVNLDDSALYRQKKLADMRDLAEEDPLEVEAGKSGLNYVKLDGNVGCMVNGAGLAMARLWIYDQTGGR
jgi:succinyl-CoA synthetase beta subunit